MREFHGDFHGLTEPGEALQELRYLRRCGERDAAKILSLDAQCIAIRHELEQKRRGFALLAELTASLRSDTDYGEIFVSASRRVNAALGMQRTAVMEPEEDGTFRASVLHGYPPGESGDIMARALDVCAELLDPENPVLVTGADPAERLISLREFLRLPYLISSPILLNGRIAAILVTGRIEEQMPFLPRLGRSDVETVQTVGAHIGAVLAERRLVETEERMRVMLDTTPLCCTLWDENRRIIDCNLEAVRLFGLVDKREYLDRFRDLSPEFQPNGRRSSEMINEVIESAFTNGCARIEWMHQDLSGSPIPADVILFRVRRGGGYIAAGYTRDLREQKAMFAEMTRTQEELVRARDMAERSAKTKGEFLANISHEIRTPMNAIMGMTNILSGMELTGQQRKYVDMAARSANILLRLIDDILDFSAIDAGRLEMEIAEFSIRDLIRDVRDITDGQIGEKPVSLSADIAAGVPDLVMGDKVRLEQVMLGIMNNAVKFTDAGEVSVRVSLKDSSAGKVRLLFDIEDTGIGMSKEQLSGVFVPFFQADASLTRRYGGTGLGLAIGKSLVELMNGEIWCESRLGAGSKFSFTADFALPAKRSGVPAEAEDGCASRDAAHGGLSGMRVLLAEDSEINQMIVTELLSCKGVNVTAVSTGLEVIDAIERDDYDLVLMDIQMPEMDGLTATARIRSDPARADLPIIALTAHAMAGDREISVKSGMNDHLTKPIDPGLLYGALMRWNRRQKVEV